MGRMAEHWAELEEERLADEAAAAAWHHQEQLEAQAQETLKGMTPEEQATLTADPVYQQWLDMLDAEALTWER